MIKILVIITKKKKKIKKGSLGYHADDVDKFNASRATSKDKKILEKQK